METLTTFEALDRKLEDCRLALQRSDDSLRGVFQTFQMAFAPDAPADPFAPEYREFQMNLYRRVAGRAYDTANEATLMDVEACIRRPFPFMTNSTTTAGQHLGAIGFLLRSMQVRPGARILEFGPGWGNTTMALARLGFAVTAVDVEARFCEVISGQAARLSLEVAVVHDDFFYAERVTEQFDAVLFFECFHHCADHLRLLRALHRVLAPGGRVYFGAEPILTDYPVPWGLRMDGEALWAIRQNGWMELGFRESYFREALHRTGWTGGKRQSVDLPWISVWEAAPRSTGAQFFAASDPRLATVVGRRTSDAIVVEAAEAGFAVYGPYVPLGPGRYRASFQLAEGQPVAGRMTVDVCTSAGVGVVASLPIDPWSAGQDGAIAIDFGLSAFEHTVEVRLFCQADAAVHITGLTIFEYAWTADGQ